MRPAEETVVRQCAPTLAGIKTGSLFPCPYQSRQQLLADIRRMNRVLVLRGLCLVPMREDDGRALLYLYRPQALCRDLGDDLACRLLRENPQISAEQMADAVGYHDEKYFVKLFQQSMGIGFAEYKKQLKRQEF